MMKIRKNGERGRGGADWLESRFSFSFADYYDPEQMGFGPLRVINEDWIAPAKGFAMHGHKDMEIVTYMIDGALRHEDSIGNGGVIRAGDVQRMTAGTGIRHSETNASNDVQAHLLQIWLHPDRPRLTPGYEQKSFTTAKKQDGLRLLVSESGRDGSLRIHLDADIYVSILNSDAKISHRLRSGRRAWLQMVEGAVMVNGQPLAVGDAMSIEDETEITITTTTNSEFLLFDMA